ncbi:hypothetical protein NKY66_11100 [Sinorhizobium meliloti]|uniref:hypothetical protein n=1 Tax=Rhizobium meliloti TaxID=382 RepID=UPI003D661300
MNSMLAKLLTTLNVAFAVIIVAGFVLVGATMGAPFGTFSFGGAVLGGLLGMIVAAFFCGFIALLATIEEHLNFLRLSAEYHNEITKLRIEHGQ